MGSPWIFENSKIQLQFPHANSWNYYELSNYNSLISLKEIHKPSSIEFSMTIFDRSKSPAEILISFAGKNEYRNWLYRIYSIKIEGNFWGIKKASFIHSDRKNKTLPLSVKNNIFVDNIKCEKISLKYGKTYNYRIEFNEDKVILFIDNEKALESVFPIADNSGHIAFSARNVKLAIDNVRVKKGDRVVFEDNFDENSIYVRTVKARVVKSEDKEQDEVEDPAAEEGNNNKN
jgi:hypothetical protein